MCKYKKHNIYMFECVNCRKQTFLHEQSCRGCGQGNIYYDPSLSPAKDQETKFRTELAKINDNSFNNESIHYEDHSELSVRHLGAGENEIHVCYCSDCHRPIDISRSDRCDKAGCPGTKGSTRKHISVDQYNKEIKAIQRSEDIHALLDQMLNSGQDPNQSIIQQLLEENMGGQ